MIPLILQGQPAFANFRINALLQQIQETAPTIAATRIVTHFIYIINSTTQLSEDTLHKTRALLNASDTFYRHEGLLVTPRKGTISPWSSKATDIFHNCGITEIIRVERGIHYRLFTEKNSPVPTRKMQPILHLLHDRMTEGVYLDVYDIFDHIEPAPCITVNMLEHGRNALEKANTEMGLALNDDEIDYLYEAYSAIKRNPTDVELVMFGQVNSEHCRHKIFNAEWIVDGDKQDRSLFSMIQNTHNRNPAGTLVAYKDNAGVLEGFQDQWFEVTRDGSNKYTYDPGPIDMVMKVETHNHPTGIAPYPGAATGVGGEIRDEAATGTGGKTKAGLSGFMVSNLRIPDFIMPWEKNYADLPTRLATPLEIMIHGPIGGARFGNEFGRPQLFGLFKTFEEQYNGRYRGYHKPIMLAGGMGNVKRIHVHKKELPKNALVIQIGGPAMRIGLGGGAASSMATGSNAADLDFDSVQRDNAEMERRCQEVIDACIALKEENPILSIHDLGAGGLSNGCPELVSKTGGKFHLREAPNEDTSMSPMEIWCCEAQERYVLAILPESLETFMTLCRRERCPAAVIGEVTGDQHLSLEDAHFNNKPIDIDIRVILGKPPKMLRDVKRLNEQHPPLKLKGINITDAVERILRLPAVANKTFLITIADRSITGMVARDQMTGPHQTPISNVAVTTTSYKSYNGEAMSVGERTAIALVSAPASGRMAVGEAITNIAAAHIGPINNIKLSANWMCACNQEGEDANLFDTVKTVGMETCPQLDISIPVGKDSLSMRTIWQTADGKNLKMTAPLSLIVSSFAVVKDARKTMTPDIKPGASTLMLLDLGAGKNRLGCSALARVYNQVGNECPDLDDPQLLVNFFNAIQELIDKQLIMAYHDRSDGGLFTTLAEMAFGAHTGLKIDITPLNTPPIPALFSEELGAVIQVADTNRNQAEQILSKHGLTHITHNIATPVPRSETAWPSFEINFRNKQIFRENTLVLKHTWSELTYRMQALRDNPQCASQEYENILDRDDKGMTFKLTFDPAETFNISSTRPPMAILREQGINGQVEMAAAFDRAGFESVDVHMTDLLGGNTNLKDFTGLVACGGFSYGDVLGAGSGWAKSILYNPALKHMFAEFFKRPDTFTLGVCNGCQMISQLKEIIPGARDWPEFTRNLSEQFEARYVTVEITSSPSVLLKGMEGSRLGIPVAHGEGRADFSKTGSEAAVLKYHLASMHYVDNYGCTTERYPFNPNGSPHGITGLTTTDGRVTIMMPHPERVFRSLQMSYRPPDMFTSEPGPWLRLFQNARKFVGQ